MAKNILKAGYQLTAYDISQPAIDDVVKHGATAAKNPADVAQKSDVVITMLANSRQVQDVITGAGGILEGAREGTVIIDMSSTAPMVIKQIYEECKKKGVKMLDAPVSGGEPKAIDGTLAIMVGGEQEVLDQVHELLMTMGSSVVLCGSIGTGNTTKLANQIIVALNIAAMSEAFALGAKAGVDPEVIYKAIRGGLAGSTVLDAKAPMVIEGNFTPGARLEIHIKDLQNALDTGHQIGMPLPLTAYAMEMMQALKADGLDQADHCVLAKYYEKLSNTKISKDK